MRTAYRTALALVLLLFASVAHAQTGACPTSTATTTITTDAWVCIAPDTDYNATDPGPNGTVVPRVVSVNLLLFGPAVTDTSTAAPTIPAINLGKPALNANNVVWVQVPALLTIPVGQLWKARSILTGNLDDAGVVKVSGRSPESNPFTRPLPPSPAPRAPLRTSVPSS